MSESDKSGKQELSNMDQIILFAKLVETGNRLKAEGENIFAGWFHGADAANVQLSFTRRPDGKVDICYCCYSKMYNFTTDDL